MVSYEVSRDNAESNVDIEIHLGDSFELTGTTQGDTKGGIITGDTDLYLSNLGNISSKTQLERGALRTTGVIERTWRFTVNNVGDIQNSPRDVILEKAVTAHDEYSAYWLKGGGRIYIKEYVNVHYDGNGATEVPSDTKSFASGITIPSVSWSGYKFLYWLGSDGNTYNANDSVVFNGDITLTAQWRAKPYYTIEARTNSTSYGTCSVEVWENGGYVPKGTSATVIEGSNVRIVATPSDGYVFRYWNGSSGSTDNPLYLNDIQSDAVHTATFAEGTKYKVTIKSADTNKGTLNREYDNEDVPEGTNISVTATAKTGYEFSKWSDDATDNPRSITVNSAINLTAQFTAVKSMYIEIDGDEIFSGGTKRVNVGDRIRIKRTIIDAGRSWYGLKQSYTIGGISHTYAYSKEDTGGTTHHMYSTDPDKAETDLILTTEGTYTIYGRYWYIRTSDRAITSELDSDKPYTIIVTKGVENYEIKTAVSPEGYGTVYGAGVYEAGQEAHLFALTSRMFVKWQDDNTEQDRWVTVTEDKTYTAYFRGFTLILTSDNADYGEVKYVKGTDERQGAVIQVEDLDSSNAEISAIPKSNQYRFRQWDDEDTSNPRLIGFTDDRAISAIFEANPQYSVKIRTENESKGTLRYTVSGSETKDGNVDGNYYEGTAIDVYTIAKSGYVFKQWSDGSTNPNRTFTVTESMDVIAYFDVRNKVEYTVSDDNVNREETLNIHLGTKFILNGSSNAGKYYGVATETDSFYIEGLGNATATRLIDTKILGKYNVWTFTVDKVGDILNVPSDVDLHKVFVQSGYDGGIWYEIRGQSTLHIREYVWVSYDANGGSVPSSTDVQCTSSGVTVPSSTRAGYVLTHWSGSDGKDYYSGDVIKDIGADLTLTAQWVQAYSISYSNVRSGTNTNPSTLRRTQFPYTLLPCTWDSEHTFIGWTTVGEPSTFITELTDIKDYTGDDALLAHWISDEDLDSLVAYRNSVEIPLNGSAVTEAINISNETSSKITVETIPYTAIVDKYAWKTEYLNPKSNGWEQYDSSTHMAKLYINPTSDNKSMYVCASESMVCGDDDTVSYDNDGNPITMRQYIASHGNFDPRRTDTQYRLTASFGTSSMTIPVNVKPLYDILQFDTSQKDRAIIQIIGEDSNGVISVLHQVDFNTITSLSENFSISVSQTVTPSYKADACFTMDKGVTEQITMGFIHKFNPPSEDDEPYDHLRWLEDNPYGMPVGSFVSSDYWSNQFFEKMVRRLIDRWQMLTDGCKFLYLPRRCNATHGRNARVIGGGRWVESKKRYEYAGVNATIKSFETKTSAGQPDQMDCELVIYIGGMYVNYV